jgi:hypothetical protein
MMALMVLALALVLALLGLVRMTELLVLALGSLARPRQAFLPWGGACKLPHRARN